MVERAARPRLPESMGEEGVGGECDIVVGRDWLCDAKVLTMRTVGVSLEYSCRQYIS